MAPRRSTTYGCMLTVLGLASPPSASAATLTPLKPCYVTVANAAREVERIAIGGSGFTPGSRVDVAVDGAPAVSGVPVDAAGSLPAGVQVRSPFIERGERVVTVVVVERGNAANSVTATTRVTALTASFAPRRVRPAGKVTFRGRGFTLAGRIYLHYRYRGKTRKRVSIRPTGPCGRFDVRRRLFPLSPVGTGRWIVQFDQQKTYSAQPDTAFVQQAISVVRRVP